MLLLTGSTGLLGGHTVYALLQRFDRIAAVRRDSSSMKELREILSYYTDDPDSLLSRIDWRTADLLDPQSLTKALEGITTVVHCAAIVSFDPRDRKRLIQNNVESTRNLVNAMTATAATHLIHVSSTSALGDSPGTDSRFLIDEETPRDMKRRHSGYSESKWGAEEVIRGVGAQGHEGTRAQGHRGTRAQGHEGTGAQGRLEWVMVNPGIILGPGQWGKGSSQLFVKAWQGLKFYPFGGTGYADVRDVADVICLFAQSAEGDESRVPFPSGERFVLVGANLRYKQFFDKVTDEFGKPNPSVYAGRFLSGLAWRLDTLRARLTGTYPLLTRETAESAQRISFYSSQKIQNYLNFRFRPIEETIEWVAGKMGKKG